MSRDRLSSPKTRFAMRRLVLAVSLAAAAIVAAGPASAWVAYRGGGGAAWHTPYGGGAVWHGPTVVAGGAPHWGYYNGGYNAGAVAAAGAVGVATGAMIGAAAASHPVYVAPAPVVVAPVVPVIGASYGALPPGCLATPAYGTTYYACGGYYYRPYYGPSGVVYTVVPAP